jgi:hypothetical protein
VGPAILCFSASLRLCGKIERRDSRDGVPVFLPFIPFSRLGRADRRGVSVMTTRVRAAFTRDFVMSPRGAGVATRVNVMPTRVVTLRPRVLRPMPGV